MVIEMLERRQLLSTTANVTGGILVVQLDNTGGNVVVQEVTDGSNNTTTVFDVKAGLPVGAPFTNVQGIVMLGGTGNDQMIALIQNVPVYMDGGSGNDTIVVQVDADLGGVFQPGFDGHGSVILGGNDTDTIIAAGLSNSTILGGNGNDAITAGAGFNQDSAGIHAGGGVAVYIDAGNGDDSIASGLLDSGGGTIFFPLADSTLLGANGSDTITDTLSNGTNTVNGGNGSDSITVVNGDVVVSSNGHDIVMTAP